MSLLQVSTLQEPSVGTLSNNPASNTILENLLKIMSIKKGPQSIMIEVIILEMAKDIQYRDTVSSIIKSLYKKLNIDPKILENKHDVFEKTLRDTWKIRGKPYGSKELKQYDFD